MDARAGKLLPLALVGAVGCGAPETTYRRTALIPAARMLPWDGRTAPAGSLRLEGAITSSRVIRNDYPNIGDSALHVPAATVDGAAAIAATNGIELGARFSYGAYSASNVSALSTMPIPSKSPVTGWGPEVRGTVRFGRSGDAALGFAGNFIFYDIPVAYWELDPACTAGPPNCYDATLETDTFGTAIYRLVREDHLSRTVGSLAIYLSYQFGGGKYGHLFGGFGTHAAFKNRGFTNDPNDPVLENAGTIPLVGIGYGIKVEWLRAAVLSSTAVTNYDSPVSYAPSTLLFTIGVDLPLWHQAPAPEQKAAPPPPPGYWVPPPGYPPPGYAPAPSSQPPPPPASSEAPPPGAPPPSVPPESAPEAAPPPTQ